MVTRGLDFRQQPAHATLPLPSRLIGNTICSSTRAGLQLRFINRKPLHFHTFESIFFRPTSFFLTFVILFQVQEMRHYDADDARGREDSSSAMPCLQQAPYQMYKISANGGPRRRRDEEENPLLRYRLISVLPRLLPRGAGRRHRRRPRPYGLQQGEGRS